MVMIRTVKEGDENAGIGEDGSSLHGRPRPYTTSSTLRLASASPDDTMPA
jgi:hypothetical protein